MIDGIRHTLIQTDAGAQRAQRAGESAQAQKSAVATAAEPEADVERIEIGLSLPTSSAGAPLDRARIDAIRSAIRDKGYPVDLDRLARTMVEQLTRERE